MKLTLLLPLVRTALWDSPLEELVLDQLKGLDATAWANLLETAEQQTVVGLVYQAASKLPAGITIPEDCFMELMTRVNVLVNRSHRLESVEKKVLSLLAAAGLHPLVMKGSSCAARYPQPELRTGGDIDLYLPEGEFTPAVRALSTAGLAPETRPDGSAEAEIRDCVVELHPRYYDLHAPAEALPPVPSPEAELVMLSAHIRKHACGVGVGLRQICDFALAWRQYPGNRAAMEELSQRLGMDKWNRLLLSFIQEYLDPSVEVSRVNPCSLLKLVERGGNFGHYSGHRQGSLSHTPLLRKADTVLRLLARLPFALRYAPNEALALYKDLTKGNLH